MRNRTVGIIGLGIMGSAIAPNLLAAGFSVVGHDLLTARVRALEEIGGRGASSAREVVESASVVVTLLPSIEAIEAVIWGEHGLLAAQQPESVVLECSTLPIACKERARDALEDAGITMLDCPLSGTGAQAVSKDLAVYASGERDAFDRCGAIFNGFARATHHVGPFGNGSKMKFIANLLVSIHNASAAEAFVLGMKAGPAPEAIYEVIGSGAGNSRMFEIRGPMMVENSYDEATMKIDTWQKDVSIISDFAREVDCPVPLFAASAQLYTAAAAQGRGKQDTASVCAVLEEMARLIRPGQG